VTVHWSRSGGGSGFDEHLTVSDDDTLQRWRTVAAGQVGAAAGVLEPGAAGRLRALAPSAPPGPAPTRAGPSSPVETVDVDGATLSFGGYDDPPEAWSALVSALRELSERPLDAVAAVDLDVDEDRGVLRLSHAGPRPLDLADPSVAVTVMAFDGQKVVVGQHDATVVGRFNQPPPAWVLEVDLPALSRGADTSLGVAVHLRAVVEGHPKLLALSAPG